MKIKSNIQIRNQGFTAIELLMSILVIGSISVVVSSQFKNITIDSKNAATRSNLAILRNAINTMNMMERLRCGKTTPNFPVAGTLQSNDITGCSPIPNPHSGTVGEQAICNFNSLINPKTNHHYTGGCESDSFSDSNYMALFPITDRPFVQDTIPKNPWQTETEVLITANTITADMPNDSTTYGPCKNAPTKSPAGKINATACGTNKNTFGADTTNGGWCYCEGNGQIWPNTGNNNALNDGKGDESTY